MHRGSRPNRYDREGTRRARVCPQQAGNTVVKASEGDRQHEPKRACHDNTLHALTCVIFVPSVRFYMRCEATIRAVMAPVSRPKWATQGAKGPDIYVARLGYDSACGRPQGTVRRRSNSTTVALFEFVPPVLLSRPHPAETQTKK